MPLKNQRLLGAHVSTAGGLLKALERGGNLGCLCIQVFAANPRGWQSLPVSEQEGLAFQQAAPKYGVQQTIIHAIYLVNLASPKPEVAAKSMAAMQRDLRSAQRLGASAMVMHPGSDLGDGLGEKRLVAALQALLPEIPAGCRLLLESMAGNEHSLGSLASLGRILRAVGERIGVCLDSAHLCAAGYDLATAAGFQRLLKDVKREIGIQAIGCIHLNDSRSACGSHRDWHENLGDGFVGQAGLSRFLKCAHFRRLPMIMETPGFDEQGPDLKNMQRLKKYCQ